MNKLISKFSFLDYKNMTSIAIIFLVHLLFGLIVLMFANVEGSDSVETKVWFIFSHSYAARFQQNFSDFKIHDYKNYYAVESDGVDIMNDEARIEAVKQSEIVILMTAPSEQNNDDKLPNLLENLSPKSRIYWISVPPVNNAQTKFTNRINEYNQKIKSLCDLKENCNFIDLDALLTDKTGNLKSEMYVENGISLNQHGFQVVMSALNSIIP